MYAKGKGSSVPSDSQAREKWVICLLNIYHFIQVLGICYCLLLTTMGELRVCIVVLTPLDSRMCRWSDNPVLYYSRGVGVTCFLCYTIQLKSRLRRTPWRAKLIRALKWRYADYYAVCAFYQIMALSLFWYLFTRDLATFTSSHSILWVSLQLGAKSSLCIENNEFYDGYFLFFFFVIEKKVFFYFLICFCG